MAADIVPELMETIKKDFAAAVAADEKIQKFLRRIRDGTAGMDEASLFARELGEKLADVLRSDITQDILPDGRLYYNIADRTIRPMLEQNFQLTNEAAKEVQQALDALEGIGLNAVDGVFPGERVEALIGSLSEEGIEWEDILKRMDEPIRNISQSFFDEYVKANAEFRHRAGLKAQIVRKLAGGACEWCKNLAGKYSYPDEVPADVYRRHDNCRCTVTFKSGRKRQDVWSKKEWSTLAELEARKSVGLNLTRLTREEAKRLEEKLSSTA